MKYSPEKLQAANDRLDLVRILIDKRSQFKSYPTIRNDETTSYHHPIKNLDALINYLCITTFDILNPKDFIQFGNWINQRTNNERDVIIQECANNDSLKQTKCILEKYYGIHGMTKAYKKFFFDIITQKQKSSILESIHIEKKWNDKTKEIEIIEDEDKKIEYILSVRNHYTHEGIQYASFGGIFTEWPGLGEGSEVMRMEKKETCTISYHTINWPFVFIEIIEDILKRNGQEYAKSGLILIKRK